MKFLILGIILAIIVIAIIKVKNVKKNNNGGGSLEPPKDGTKPEDKEKPL